MTDARPIRRADWIWTLAIFAGVLALLLGSAQMGFTRDESFYFHAAFEYLGWFEELFRNFENGELARSFTQANIDAHWSYNKEHPVLMKALFALSYKLFSDELGWMSASTAMRFPGMVTGALLVAMVHLFGTQLFGRTAGLVGAAALLLQPRFFFHAHLTCFDVPIAAMWFAVVYAYWRSYESKGWALATGVLWGLALSTKLNAFFLPIVLVIHWLIASWRGFGIVREDGRVRLRVPPVPWAFVSMAVFGPILFYALWPRHWFDTVARVQWYMEFHLKHVHYFVYYFGRNIQQPPFPVSYPWVMTLVTVPATILLAFAVGGAAWIRARVARARAGVRDVRATGWLLAINLVFPIALIAMPETPIFGGTKHWMPAMPYLAMLAGAGVVFAARHATLVVMHRLQSAAAPTRVAVSALLAAAVLAPPAYATHENHPFGTSYYNELIGSHRGAADARMMRQFWGYTSRQALDWLNENAPKNARVWTHNTTGYAWSMYRRDGLVREDLRAGGLRGSDYALYHHQKAFVYKLTEVWEEYGTRTPVHVVSVDGVPVLSVYERPSTTRKRQASSQEP